jgi:hypothetical protein
MLTNVCIVTDLCIHPSNFECILTSSLDGSAKLTNTSNIEYHRNNLMSEESLKDTYQLLSETILEEVPGAGAITSLDCIHGQNIHFPPLGLAGSSIGGLWTFPLADGTTGR